MGTDYSFFCLHHVFQNPHHLFVSSIQFCSQNSCVQARNSGYHCKGIPSLLRQCVDQKLMEGLLVKLLLLTLFAPTLFDKICVVADDEATGCNSITRKVCVASTKLVDQSSGKLPAPLDFEGICRAIPKGTCADQTVTVGKTTCSLP